MIKHPFAASRTALPSQRPQQDEQPLPTTPDGKEIKGVYIDDLIFLFLKGKLVLAKKDEKDHLTVHFGNHSGFLDVHKTTRLRNGETSYETLLQISHGDLASALRDLTDATLDFLNQIVQPLPLARLGASGAHAVLGIPYAREHLFQSATYRKGKAVIDPQKLAAKLDVLDSVYELLSLPDDKMFTVMSLKNSRNPRRLGIGFMRANPYGLRKLYWIEERRLDAALRVFSPKLMETFDRYRVPPKPKGQ